MTKPRCERTNNPCGTDTWAKGSSCWCGPCRGYAYGLAQAYERAEAVCRERHQQHETLAHGFASVGNVAEMGRDFEKGYEARDCADAIAKLRQETG